MLRSAATWTDLKLSFKSVVLSRRGSRHPCFLPLEQLFDNLFRRFSSQAVLIVILVLTIVSSGGHSQISDRREGLQRRISRERRSRTTERWKKCSLYLLEPEWYVCSRFTFFYFASVSSWFRCIYPIHVVTFAKRPSMLFSIVEAAVSNTRSDPPPQSSVYG